jgi:hypothetical protein
LSERVSAVRGAVFSPQGVEVRRATDYVCMFGISVPAGILYEKVVGCECGGMGTRINVVYLLLVAVVSVVM